MNELEAARLLLACASEPKWFGPDFHLLYCRCVGAQVAEDPAVPKARIPGERAAFRAGIGPTTYRTTIYSKYPKGDTVLLELSYALAMLEVDLDVEKEVLPVLQRYHFTPKGPHTYLHDVLHTDFVRCGPPEGFHEKYPDHVGLLQPFAYYEERPKSLLAPINFSHVGWLSEDILEKAILAAPYNRLPYLDAVTHESPRLRAAMRVACRRWLSKETKARPRYVDLVFAAQRIPIEDLRAILSRKGGTRLALFATHPNSTAEEMRKGLQKMTGSSGAAPLREWLGRPLQPDDIAHRGRVIGGSRLVQLIWGAEYSRIEPLAKERSTVLRLIAAEMASLRPNIVRDALIPHKNRCAFTAEEAVARSRANLRGRDPTGTPRTSDLEQYTLMRDARAAWREAGIPPARMFLVHCLTAAPDYRKQIMPALGHVTATERELHNRFREVSRVNTSISGLKKEIPTL